MISAKSKQFYEGRLFLLGSVGIDQVLVLQKHRKLVVLGRNHFSPCKALLYKQLAYVSL